MSRSPSSFVRLPLAPSSRRRAWGSECLWRLTPRRALDEVDTLVRRMWRGSLRHPRKQQGKWQVSQVRLAHDIAHTTIALEPLDRYVSRSRRQSVVEAAQADLQRRYAVVDGQRGADGPDLIDPLLDLGWEDAFLPEEDEVLDPSLDENDDASLDTRNTAEPISAEERAIAFVQYDETLEARRRNKPFMEPI